MRKLRRFNFDELRVRGAQKVAALAERRGWSSLTRLPEDQAFPKLLDLTGEARDPGSAQAILNFFRSHKDSCPLSAFDNRKTTIDVLQSRWPGAADSLLERAGRILEGKFDLLALRDIGFGDPIDWHFEPISGKRSPLIHWSRLNELDADLSGDKKILWELNRHQHFVLLGQAYWLTNDECYAKAFVSHLKSWMDQNPPKLGVHWTSSLEIAFRSISWLWAFRFFEHSPSLTPDVFTRALKFLYLNARHLETYLSTYSSPNTHLTGEALGLFYLGTMLREFNEAKRWRETGREILLKWLPRHIKPDGVYFEQSSYYHRYTSDFYTHFIILSRASGEALPDDVENKLQALLDHLMYITRPDGTTPLFGDDDGGRLVFFERTAANDFRSTLSTGAALFDRPDYKCLARDAAQETLWLLGPDGLKKFDTIHSAEPAELSTGFKNGGYYVMRDGWTPDSNYLLFDCGPHGVVNCGHAHADALSFELVANGRTLLVDPGTYTYTASKEMRDWFRGSVAHNTLTIDGQSSSVPAGPFSWKVIAHGECLNWISRDRFDFVEGTHKGYARLPQPVYHSRSILFLKKAYWIIRDQLRSRGDHRADIWFHFDSGATPLIEALDSQTTAVSARDDTGGLDICSFAQHGKWRRDDAWVSHCYGEKQPARVYAFSISTTGNADLISFLMPQPKGVARRVMREIEAVGGQAFEVTHENGLDVVMIRDGQAQRVETERLASDFAWTWARFDSGQEATPSEFVLFAGTSLELEGQEILRSGRPIDYLVASRKGDQFRVETNEGVLDLQLPVTDFEAAFAQLTLAKPN